MIPTNLEECFVALKEKLIAKDLAFLKENEDAPVRLHHTLGRYLRNTWGLWGEETSKLKSYFHDLGIHHPDDMSGIILTSFHRHLNDKPLEIEAQVKRYQDYWKQIRE